MAKIDKVKELIGWLKVVFGVLVAIDMSLVGWLANSYDKSDIAAIKIYLCLFAIVLISIGIVFTNKKVISNIDELGEL